MKPATLPLDLKPTAPTAPAARPDAPIASPGPDTFDWETDDAVVVPPRPGVAVYENPRGDVVIRVQNIDDPDDYDHFAFLGEDALRPVIDALTRYARRR